MKQKERHRRQTRQSQRRGRRGNTSPKTTEQYRAKPKRFQELWDRVVGVVSKMRSEKTSLQRTSRQAGVSPRSVIRLGGSALRKGPNGRYVAKPSDRLLRVLVIPSANKLRQVAVRGSRQATVLGEYWNGVRKYLATGDSSGLKKFQGKKIPDANGAQIPLITDLAELNRLGSAGVLSFESMYARST